MMKVALACTFLLALTYSVSAEMIECYACIEGELPTLPGGKSIQSYLGSRAGGLPDIPASAKCTENIENSTTVKIDNEKQSCAKVDIEVTILDKTTEATIRGVVDKDKCPDLEKQFSDAVDEANSDDVDGSLDCYECFEDKCNLASTIQVSFLMLLAPALAYLMRS